MKRRHDMFGTKKEKRTVAIYARVSTEHEAQLNAIENQKQWYFEFVRNHPDWSFYDMYADEGITGTSAEKRPNFMRMMEDAKENHFDLIITREVSRFARNPLLFPWRQRIGKCIKGIWPYGRKTLL